MQSQDSWILNTTPEKRADIKHENKSKNTDNNTDEVNIYSAYATKQACAFMNKLLDQNHIFMEQFQKWILMLNNKHLLLSLKI